MRDYPPAHVIHEASCEDNPGELLVFKAHNLVAWPNSIPHRCVSRRTITSDRDVVAEPINYEPHEYEPSTLRPADAVKALCKVCRGTHGSEVDLRQFLGLER